MHNPPLEQKRDVEAAAQMEVLTLSALDQVHSRNHVCVLFCFPLPEGTDTSEIIHHLRQGLQSLAASLPILKGRIRPRHYPRGTPERKGFLDLVYDPAEPEPVLIARHFGNEYPSYQQLKQNNFYLQGDPLSDPLKACNTTCPNGCLYGSVINIQANFIRGGLIMSFSFHHTAFDAVGCATIAQLFASYCAGQPNTALLSEALTPRVPASHSLPYEVALRWEGPIIGPWNDARSAGHILPNTVYSMFRIPAKTLPKLKATVSSSLPREGLSRWISTLDAVNALLWTCVARARAPLMSNEESMCALIVAVNVRARLDKPLPPNYLGNCIAGSWMERPLSTLTESEHLADVAALIRANYVSTIHDQRIRALITMVDAEPDIGLKFTGPPLPTSAFLVTSWATNPVYADFGGLLGVPENVCTPCGSGMNGQCVIQPRKPLNVGRSDGDGGGGGGVGGELGDLIFNLCIESEAVDRLQRDEEWTRWVELIQK